MRNRFVLGNWKLNGSLAANSALLARLAGNISAADGRNCGICVPYVYLAQAQNLLRESVITWGSQDVSRYEIGAYTGDVSASMVAEFGSRLAIVGHSERRSLFGDSDAVVAQKFARAKRAGLIPVFCVGETLVERESGNTVQVVSRQLDAVIAANGIGSLRGAILAYEPVWAIGTGKTATPAEAEAVHVQLRRHVAQADAEVGDSLPILYGGSVKASNAAELFSMPNIDGGLIGGASLVADEFLGIWRAL
ncbi:MAG TPA: triose-phosphate isomerase [Usitatibacteraceae bacterium]